MSDRDFSLYYVDILIASDKIRRYIGKFDSASSLLHSELEWDATIRELQIIGDATGILLKNGLIDDSFRRIVDFRNQIVHGYFGIDEKIVWEIVKEKMQKFSDELLNIVKSKHIDLTDAIKSAIKENHYNLKVVSFLTSKLELL